MIDIFHADTHFSYLQLRLKMADRGSKTRLAEFLSVRPSFISQVLAGKYSLSLEQADLTNQFFDQSQEESDFFLLLVAKDRAATPSLKKQYERQLEAIRKRRMQVVERLGKKGEISDEVRRTYYSSWIFAAVHIACTIPHLRTRRALTEYLRIPIERTETALQFLLESQLLKREGEIYVPTENWVRIGSDSPYSAKLHSNWRQKAVQNLDVQGEDDLHYSGVFSLDKKTALRIKDSFLEFIKAQVKEISEAKEEDLYVFSADLFKLVK